MSAIECKTRAGNYLTFDLQGERYGFETMRVVAIIGIQPITPLPQAPGHVKGLTMVRGKVLPVIDARRRLGMPDVEPTAETCIILLNVGTGQTRVIVDAVHNVVDLVEEQFEDLQEGIDSDDLVGVARVENHIVTVLDVDGMTKFS